MTMDKYYQLEFLSDVKGDIGMEGNLISNISIAHTRPYWALTGTALPNHGRIVSKDEAIARAKDAMRRDEKHESWNVSSIEYLPTGRVVTSRPSYTAWRVVETSRAGRKVVWLDTRPHVRQMLRDMHVA